MSDTEQRVAELTAQREAEHAKQVEAERVAAIRQQIDRLGAEGRRAVAALAAAGVPAAPEVMAAGELAEVFRDKADGCDTVATQIASGVRPGGRQPVSYWIGKRDAYRDAADTLEQAARLVAEGQL